MFLYSSLFVVFSFRILTRVFCETSVPLSSHVLLALEQTQISREGGHANIFTITTSLPLILYFLFCDRFFAFREKGIKKVDSGIQEKHTVILK